MALACSWDSSVSAMADQVQLSGVHSDHRQGADHLTDPKGRRHSIVPTVGGSSITAKGAVNHDDLISQPEGIVVTSSAGAVLGHEAAAQRVHGDHAARRGSGLPEGRRPDLDGADIFPGARVLEAGAGSGALTCSLLRAIGPSGRLISYERREDFATIARRNVENFFGQARPAGICGWPICSSRALRNPSTECPRHARSVGVRCGAGRGACPGRRLLRLRRDHHQLAETVETLRVHSGFTEPEATESLVRAWHVRGWQYGRGTIW